VQDKFAPTVVVWRGEFLPIWATPETYAVVGATNPGSLTMNGQGEVRRQV